MAFSQAFHKSDFYLITQFLDRSEDPYKMEYDTKSVKYWFQKLCVIVYKSQDAAIQVQCWHLGAFFIASYNSKAIVDCWCLHSQRFSFSYVVWVRETFHMLKMESLWQHDHPPPPSAAAWLCHALNKWLDLCNANVTLWVKIICIYSIHKAIYSPSAACYFVLLSRKSGLQWLEMQLKCASKVERLYRSKAVNVNSSNNYSVFCFLVFRACLGLLISVGRADVKHALEHACFVNLQIRKWRCWGDWHAVSPTRLWCWKQNLSPQVCRKLPLK